MKPAGTPASPAEFTPCGAFFNPLLWYVAEAAMHGLGYGFDFLYGSSDGGGFGGGYVKSSGNSFNHGYRKGVGFGYTPVFEIGNCYGSGMGYRSGKRAWLF